jgi:hypothetical protein
MKENYDFIPLDRALSLAGMGKDSTETKIDDLLYHVTSIVEKQRREIILRQFSTIRIPSFKYDIGKLLNQGKKTPIPRRLLAITLNIQKIIYNSVLFVL